MCARRSRPRTSKRLHIDPELPVVAIVISERWRACRAKSATRSRRIFGDRKDAKVFEDIKRLEKSFPEAAAKIRELAKPDAEDLVVVVAGAKRGEAASAIKARQQAYAIYAAAGQLRLALGHKYADRHGAFQARQLPIALGYGFPDVRVG